MVTDPSLRVGIVVATAYSSVVTKSLEPRTQVRSEILALDRELHDRLDVVEAVAGVVATPAEDDAVHPAGLLGGACHLLQRVRQLDLAARARLGVLQDAEHLRPQHVTPDDGEVGRVEPVAGFSTSPVTRTTSSVSVASTVATP